METTMGAKWGMPAFGLLMGAVLLAASAAGGQPGVGLGMFAVMVIYSGVLVAFGGRSETVGVLRGQPTDERLAGFSLAATAVAGLVAIIGVVLPSVVMVWLLIAPVNGALAQSFPHTTLSKGDSIFPLP